jgi:hypothetical protein
MFARISRLWHQFLNKSQTINNEPLNKVSLIVIVAIDLVIIVNVLTGLNDISNWYLNPSAAYPCYFEWDNYRNEKNTKPPSEFLQEREYQIISLSLPNENEPLDRLTFRQQYLQVKEGHLGSISNTCLQYADSKDKLNNPNNRQIVQIINQKQEQISKLESNNQTIRSQYDSTLLEKIAGQEQKKSINQISAEKAKQELERNNRQIATLKKEITNLKNKLLKKPESLDYINFLNNEATFKDVEKQYNKASFWYSSIQLGFQTLFLLPLILIAVLIHNFAQRKEYGLIALISWHLLVIFFLPLIFKIFEFLQIGAIFQFLFEIISKLLGGLLFLISYIYILLVPLVGFGIIKFCQNFVFNSKIQTAKRVQKLRCIKCAKKIRPDDSYCPHCGYYQYSECDNCHNLTYKHLPYCKECGHFQERNNQ